MRRVLVLDDEINVLHALQRTLRQIFPDKDFRIEIFSDPEQALLRVGEVSFDIIVSDYWMPGINGIDFLKTVKSIQPDAVRLILSASTEFSTVMEAINQAEIFRFISKPWSQEELKKIFLLAIERRGKALEERQLADELRMKRGELEPQELEARRLEEQEPGITKVNWGADGSVYLHGDTD
ncbi:response regulator [Herminiimonas fonticola]|uniref:Response regulator receiver domain-containing protein n=1 Tax=Herminiimonas fonticola TaxID=303380 RepID=A0A4R6G2C3_9BURK|nr:response regulator [Herminiimonas fonticola]RBA22882.1 Response regulator receiver domain [Herminiimonas fonticola]TDN87694.1 response regulator receiver domain-containing protein [Herminiimonas fonticola]